MIATTVIAIPRTPGTTCPIVPRTSFSCGWKQDRQERPRLLPGGRRGHVVIVPGDDASVRDRERADHDGQGNDPRADELECVPPLAGHRARILVRGADTVNARALLNAMKTVSCLQILGCDSGGCRRASI